MRRARRAADFAVLIALAWAAAGLGCGGVGPEQTDAARDVALVREVVSRHYEGIRGLDSAMICGTLSAHASRLLALAAPRKLAIGGRSERHAACVLGLDNSFRRAGYSKDELAVPAVSGVLLRGGRAVARLSFPDGVHRRLPVLRDGGEWRAATVGPLRPRR